jgi:hypothetical protein
MFRRASIAVVSSLLLMAGSASAEPKLEVAIGAEVRHFARDALLARPDLADIELALDSAYGKPMRYRNWPGRRMPSFSADRMSDREIDLVIRYLAHMAGRRTGR